MTDESVYVLAEKADWTHAKPKKKPSRDVFSEQAIRAFMDKHLNETAPSPQMRGLKARKKKPNSATEPEVFKIARQQDERWPGRLGALLSRLRSR
ncbi:hypothetical protein [Ruegeria jejuensis]|uniref:hypothetical protein n=1 Tax=Ruegeria jejuensis TaxID=3233338 RepID=UPI00355B0C27